MSEHEQGIIDRLQEAFARKKKLITYDESVDDVDLEISDLKRKLRKGGILKRGGALGDKYDLLSEIGNGGFATVWKAFDRVTEEVVAIKVMHPSSAKDPIKRERFFRGARVMEELNHEGVVSVLEPRGNDDDFFYFVMEYVEGGNLHQSVKEKKVVPYDCTKVLARILEILSCAHEHSNNYIHRDVKPTNVLIRDDGEILLTDFDLEPIPEPQQF